MTDRVAVAEQIIAIATIEAERRPVATAVAVEQAPVATAVVEQGMAGPPGASAAAPRSYAIIAAASIAAAHGLPFAPEAWIVTPDGEVVDTDIRHGPGVTTAIFPGPFTGTLYLR